MNEIEALKKRVAELEEENKKLFASEMQANANLGRILSSPDYYPHLMKLFGDFSVFKSMMSEPKKESEER